MSNETHSESLHGKIDSLSMVIRKVNNTIIKSKSEKDLLNTVCENLSEYFYFCWIGYRDELGTEITPVARSKQINDFSDEFFSNIATKKALKNREVVLINNFELECPENIKNDFREKGFLSAVFIPLYEENIEGNLNIFSDIPDFFPETTVNQLLELAQNISIMLNSIYEKKVSEQKFSNVEDNFYQVIHSMALIAEIKDIFLKGHHYRVAQLSRAIAKELKLSEEQCKTLYVAAFVHDVGKMTIPTEILHKPGSISKGEFEVIMAHPRIGYDILRGIYFPGSIAEIVLQHHERMDGTGYPQGLAGDEILLESRILGLADVVESMLSHRPYRPARTIDYVIEEITANSGTYYDSDAVDACLRLFNEKRFQFA